MRAATWQGRHDVRVVDVPDPRILTPDDAVVRITTTGLCGSDLHLYEVLGPFMEPGDVLGHEGMGIVEEVGSDVTQVQVGDRVVVPFPVACGTCWMCERGLVTQCETTQVRAEGTGATLFGYSKLYGSLPGAQAERLRVPFANFGPLVVPEGPPDEHLLLLADVLPTAWQAVEYAAVPVGGTLLVLGLGPIGQMCVHVAGYLGIRVIGVDRVQERLDEARRAGAETIDLDGVDDVAEEVRSLTSGRGADSVVDAVGMEAHGSPVAEFGQKMMTLAPRKVAAASMRRLGVDRAAALFVALDAVRRGGTVSLSGVYGGMSQPMPLMSMFDKQIQLRMGQANVQALNHDLLTLVLDDADPLGLAGFSTRVVPLEDAATAYEEFQRKEAGAVKVMFRP